MTALLMLLGDFFGGLRGMTVMLFVGVAMNFFAYWNSDKMVLAHYDAQQVDRNSAPELYGIVEKLAKKANIPMPKVYIMPLLWQVLFPRLPNGVCSLAAAVMRMAKVVILSLLFWL